MKCLAFGMCPETLSLTWVCYSASTHQKTNYKKEKKTNLPIQKQGTCIIKKISTWALYILNMKTTIILRDIY
jgi:hypothetical protein